MTIRILAAVGFGTGLLLAADQSNPVEAKQTMQISDTQRLDFPSGGTLRLKHSIGVLTVEAWDRPDVEITTVKYTKADIDAHEREGAAKQLQRVSIATERRGNELVVTTNVPRHWGFSSLLEYYIKAPVSARIVDEHHSGGNVNIDRFTGDIDVNLSQGEILLHLPEDRQYSIQARSTFGNVNSDFSQEKRRWWLLGHRSVSETTPSPQKLNLKVRSGDIVLLRTRVPKAPDQPIPTAKPVGL